MSGIYKGKNMDMVNRDIRRLAEVLISYGMKDMNVAIMGEQSYEWAISYLAITFGVGTVVPIDKEFCMPEIKRYLIETKCHCAIFSGELEDTFWQIKNDGVTELELIISMDCEKSYNDVLSLRELINGNITIL